MPSSNYPTSLDTSAQQPTPASTTDLDASGYEHDQVHGAHSTALIALEAKLGIAANNAADADQYALMQKSGSGVDATTTWSKTLTGSTLAGTTLSGAVTGADQVMSTVTHKDYAETVYAGGDTATAKTLAETNGNVQTWTMTGNCTFTMPSGSGLQAGTSLTLILTQDGTGSRTGTFTSVKWAEGTAPTLTTTATTGIDILTFVTFNGGVSPVWYGFAAGLAMA
tara:strand:+ start:20377 stop:21048 length:672 start_codon:yes stop_codon:yes gene_type:complete